MRGHDWRIIEVGRWYERVTNVKNVLGNENLKATICTAENDRTKITENAEYLKYWDSMITNDARCTREIKCRIAVANVAFNKKKEETNKLQHLEGSRVW
jgi:uncharacterized alpha-E superfamily protein